MKLVWSKIQPNCTSLFVCYRSKVKTANLLGIVGTDVPVEEIQKLVPPYKVQNKVIYIVI